MSYVRACPQGWLTAYGQYTSMLESPEPFHLWTGMSVLSGALRRHAYVSQGHFAVYPNLYVVLISPPGTCRKTTAMLTGVKLLRKVSDVHIEANQLTPQSLIMTLSGGEFMVTKGSNKPTASPTPQAPKVTPISKNKSPKQSNAPPPTKSDATIAALKQALGTNGSSTTTIPKPDPTQPQATPVINLSFECSAMLASTELSVMLGADAQHNGMLSLLTDFFDCPDIWDRNTLTWGPQHLENVFVNILGCTTPDFLGTSIPKDAIGGGLTSRMIFIYQSQKRHDNPRPIITQKEIELRKRLIDDLNHIATYPWGEFHFDKDGGDWFDHWYINGRADSLLDERFWGYLERKPDHLIKSATIIASSFDDNKTLTRPILEMALALLDRAEDRMPEAFKGVGTATGRDIERIVDILLHQGGTISHRDLAARCVRNLNKPELQIVLDTMEEAGMVTQILNSATRQRIISLNASKNP